MSHFYTETAAAHEYGSIDFFGEIHEDGKKMMGATIINEKKNFEIYKVNKLLLCMTISLSYLFKN